MPSVDLLGNLERALACADRGWPVFPVGLVHRVGGGAEKRPNVRRWKTEATTDPEKVREWWARDPMAHVGVVTGERSGLYVLDEDAPNASRDLMLAGDVPSNPTRRPGGRHLYFASAGEALRNRVDAERHLDFRGEGGFVVMWADPPEGDLPRVPTQVGEWVQAGRSAAPVAPRYEGESDPDWGRSLRDSELERLRRAPSGERNHTLFRVACVLLRAVHGGHLDEDMTVCLLEDASFMVGLEPHEVQRTLQSAREATADQASGPHPAVDEATVRKVAGLPPLAPPAAPDGDEDDPEYRADRAEWDARQIQLAEEPSTWTPASPDLLSSVVRGESRRTEPTVFRRSDDQPLVYPARVNLFLGEPEGCKTWAALVAVAQEIRAGNAAALVDLEDSVETAVERLTQLGLTEEQVRDGFVYCCPTEPFGEVAAAHLRVWRDGTDRALTLAVVDSMTEAMSLKNLDPDKGRDVTAFYHGLPRFLANDLGAAVVVIDHVTKTTDGRGRWAIGSERKISGLNGAAYAFTATEPFGRGTTGKVRITVSKDRPGYVRQFATGKAKVIATMTLVSSPVDGSVEALINPPSAEGAAQEEAAQRVRIAADILELVTEHPGATATEIDLAVTGESGALTSVRKTMVEDGRLVVRSVGPRRLHFPVQAGEDTV